MPSHSAPAATSPVPRSPGTVAVPQFLLDVTANPGLPSWTLPLGSPLSLSSETHSCYGRPPSHILRGSALPSGCPALLTSPTNRRPRDAHFLNFSPSLSLSLSPLAPDGSVHTTSPFAFCTSFRPQDSPSGRPSDLSPHV